ncbi:MAG: SBBP repeat-containing protein, partial [Nanoarchaeota archaeon]|nr:SBBP repeat-containing protein [Nanoarchaeota archaeon]
MKKPLIILSCLILLFGIGIYHNIFDTSASETIKTTNLTPTINTTTTFSMPAQTTDLKQKEHSQEVLSSSAPNYIKNYGQIPDNSLKFYTGVGGSVNTHFTNDGIYYIYDNEIIQIDIVGGNFENPIGKQITPEIIIYETNEFSKSNIETYSKVLYPKIYPGISLEIESLTDGDKITYILEPESDHTQIKTRLSNEQLSFLGITETGNLEYELNDNQIIEEAPVCYQLNNNNIKEYIDCSYKITKDDYISYNIADYDTNKQLFIDPVKKWSLVVGSDYYKQDYAYDVAVGDDGYIYMVGKTEDVLNFCNSTNKTSEGPSSSTNIYVIKFDDNGNRIWTYFISSSSSDDGSRIATYNNNIFFIGSTYNSENFGNSNNKIVDGTTGSYDVFVVKLDSSGNRVWTFIGASDSHDYGRSIAVDNYGVYITGKTNNGSGFCNSRTSEGSLGGNDVFVIKLNHNGELQWTYVAGSSDLKYESGEGIAILNGYSYIVGYSYDSTNFAGSINKYSGGTPGSTDVFILKLNNAGQRQWTYIAGGSNPEFGFGITVDNSGNSFVTGYTYSNTDFTGGVTQSEGTLSHYDVFLLKLSNSGSKQWATLIGSTTSKYEYSYDICLDSSGNSYVTGYSSDSANLGNPTNRYFEGASGGLGEPFIIKFNSAGTRLWTFVGRSGSGYNYGKGITIEGNFVYAVGYTQNGAEFANPTNKIIEGETKDNDGFLMKLNKDTGVRQWTFIAASGIGNNDYSYSVVMDDDENIYMVGNTDAQSRFGDDTNKSYEGVLGSTDVFVMKVNKTGQRQWTYISGSENYDYGQDIELDSNNNIYVTGYTYDGTNFAGSSNKYTVGVLGGYDVFVIKLNTIGQRQWTYIAGSIVSNHEFGKSIAVDTTGNSYVTGYTYDGTNFAGSSNKLTEGELDKNDVFVIKLNTIGQRQWTYIAGSNVSKSEIGEGIAVDTSGNSYVAGYTYDGTNFAGSSNKLTEGELDRNDVFVIKLNTIGQRQWTYIAGSNVSKSDYSRGIAVDTSGNSYAVGCTDDGINLGDADNKFIEGIPSSNDVFVIKLNSAGSRMWTFIGASTDSKNDQSYDIALDDNNNSHITGYTYGGINFTNSNNKSFDGILSSLDTFVMKLNSSGKRQWTHLIGGMNDSNEYAQAITINGAGTSIYLTGNSNAGANFAGSSETEGSLSGNDAFIMKLEDTQVIAQPTYSNFDGDTTNFSEEGNLSNIINLTLEITGKGKIKFQQDGINVGSTDFNTHV